MFGTGGAAGAPLLPSTGGDPGFSVAVTTPDSGVSKPTMPAPDAPVLIDQCAAGNAAGIADADVQKLVQGSGQNGTLRWLYPYAGTVFPRGLLAPLLMWDGATADALYVHIKSSSFEYKGCLVPTGPGQLQLAQDVWDQATAHAKGASDPYTVELTVLSGGAVTGPITEQVIVSPATLKGSIFYNSYSSALAAKAGGFGGAVLRIAPGKGAEVFLGQTGCTGCHSVSANGTRLITDPVLAGGGATYAIAPASPVNPPALKTPVAGATFAGVFPDGSLYLSSAHQGAVGTRSTGNGDPNATLYETDTGAVVPNTAIPTGAMTPTFSPDGSLLTFNDFAINGGHGLAVMSFDKTARTAAAYKQIYSTDTLYPGWPFFLPDDKAIVFALGASADFSGMGAGLFPGLSGPASDLYIVDVAAGTSRILAKAMGYATEQDATANKTYLPFGAEELHQNYYPTVSPVAAGGYFWMFFDTVRHYGSLGSQRQLWGTAIEISPDGTYSADPSNPPFYLTGQEVGTGNHRAFTALDPCRKDGDSCTTGIDCCGGYCTDGKCGAPVVPRCSNTDETCATSADCCNSKDHCISGYCGELTVR